MAINPAINVQPAPPDCFRASGLLLLRADGSVLLQLRDDKPGISAPATWVFPGGGCEPGESAGDCALREFHEETGYRCTDAALVTEFRYECPDTTRSFWLSFWWAQYDGLGTVACFEGQEVRFVTRHEAQKLRVPYYLDAVWDLALAEAKITLPAP